MIYSDLYTKNKLKIPTIAGLLFLLVVVVFFARLFSSLSLPSKASKKIIKRLEIASLTPSQTVIFWQTENKESGWVVYGERNNQLNQIAFDERDLPNQKGKFINHYVTLKNLHESQNYFFKIVSDNKLVSNSGELPFTLTTPKNNGGVKNNLPIYGKVVGSNNNPIENAVVLAALSDSYLLSALSKPTGEWLIPLNILIEKNSLKSKTPKKNEELKIEIIGENGETTNIITSVDLGSPLPQTVVIGKNYNFLTGNDVLSAITSSGQEEEKREIDIIYPQENAAIPGYTPIIKGTAIPNQEVMVDVRSDKIYSSRVTAGNDGLWKLVIPEKLALGEHLIILTARDRLGRDVKIQRKFIIVANEGNEAKVLGLATPSATVTTGPTNIPTATPIKVASPSAPVSGSNFNLPIVGAASMIIFGLGLILVF